MSKNNYQNSIFPILATVIFFLFGILLAEVSYRFYLNFDKQLVVDTLSDEIKGDQFSFFSHPIGLLYNADYGFDYYNGDITFGTVRDGRVIKCETRNSPDRSIDAINANFAAYEKADYKIILLGSSYTATRDENGLLATDIASHILSKKLGASVVIQNLSQGSTGLLTMMDMAPYKAAKYNPDLVLFALNTMDVARVRWWPVYHSEGNGFYRYYQTQSADVTQIKSHQALLHNYVISDRINRQWCADYMNMVADSGTISEETQRFVEQLVQQYQNIQAIRKVPSIDVDLWDFSRSFLYNRIRHGSPYYQINLYKNTNPMAPTSLKDFRQDQRFMKNWKKLQETGTPFHLVHIPYYPEIKQNKEFVYGYGGVPEDKVRELFDSLDQLSGGKILSLLKAMKSPRADASTLIVSENDWHPNHEGTRLMGEALAEVLIHLPAFQKSN